MTGWDVAFEAGPSDEAWVEICRLVEGMPETAVAEIAARLRAWPDRLRAMPDRWWAQRQAGDHRPWHALATHRTLCRVGEYFCVSAVACPNDLTMLLAGSGVTGNNDLGEVLLLRPDPDIDTNPASDPETDLLVASPAEQATAVDALFSSDGSQVTVGFADLGGGVGPVVYGVDGRRRYHLDLDTGGDAADEIGFGRVGQSGDGRLIAGGSTETQAVLVAEAATGEVLLRADGGTGPVALDHTGRLVAYACPSGQVAVRDVSSGESLFTGKSGLTTINALAFSPDASRLVAAGDDHPTACLLALDRGGPTSTSQVTVADPALTIDSTTPVASYAAKASWTDRGPLVFVADDERAVLFDASSGRVRWGAAAALVTASFTPDGRVLVASGLDGVINAWFLDSLAAP
ncbi:hypothetical protein [Actinoallomurus sp. NPDC050550]|uniref:WD40 repeat domain-containing protein n=1 Tax=Actinoallomurus sp. NPDC050550 TaxID=3154937 RepID=UPI0033D58985